MSEEKHADCPECDGTGTVLVDICQAGDQTLQEEWPCPECSPTSDCDERERQHNPSTTQWVDAKEYNRLTIIDHDTSVTLSGPCHTILYSEEEIKLASPMVSAIARKIISSRGNSR